jgi:hypothetical protein
MSKRGRKKGFEAILRDLRVLPSDTRTEDRLLIAKVLSKLPRHVREDVSHSTERPTFIVCSPTLRGISQRLISPKSDLERYVWYIFLRFPLHLKGLSSKRMMTTIAHEIAHFKLRHGPGGSEAEKVADDLCEKWGFGRAYRSHRQLQHLRDLEIIEQADREAEAEMSQQSKRERK